MDHRDREAIEELFARLAEVERRSDPRDREAEALISEHVSQQPAAPYYMAQTVVVQAQALEAAQRRIEELEAQSSGGFLGGLFGGGRQSASAGRGYRMPDYDRGGQGGGFLAGAAQTAVGVAGGVLLANLVAGAFVGSAYAAEPGAGEPDAGGDDGFDAGGGFDTGGGFDFGDF